MFHQMVHFRGISKMTLAYFDFLLAIDVLRTHQFTVKVLKIQKCINISKICSQKLGHLQTRPYI